MTTRAEFFQRIRMEMQRTRGLFRAAPAPRPERPREAAELLQRQLIERWPETLDRFRREFERVGGVLHRVATAADVPGVITTLARERAAAQVVTWHAAGVGAPLRMALEAKGLEVTAAVSLDPDATAREHTRAAAATAGLGVTGVDLAVAETGTLVLRAGPGRPRATSLLPPTHVAVFAPAVLVESLTHLGVFLEAWHVEDGRWGAMINLVTGPSRTADIELTLTRGVHGPREVHAVFVEGGLDE